MSDYSAPVRDIKFVLDHIVDIGSLTALPDFSHVERDVVFGLVHEAARFMGDVVAPLNRIGDIVGSQRNDDGTVTTPDGFQKAYEQYVTAGWNGMKSDPAYGGYGFPASVAIAIQEMLTAANMAFSLCPMLTMSAILAIEHHGTDEQKATYLEKLISGEWTGTMVLTEPEAGSDVGALRAKAEPQDDGSWRLTGTKIFITWGEHDLADNIIHLVLARAPGAPPGTRGISLFIVPKFLVNPDGSLGERNDVTCVSIEHKVGINASPTCVLAFGEQQGAVAYLVGEVNQGMRAMFTMMNDARLHVGLEGLGIAERSYQQSVAHARERRQGRAIGAAKSESSPIVDHPDVRRMLMTMKASIEALRALLYDNAKAIDLSHHHPDPATREANAGRASLLTPVGKSWGTDLGVELTSLGIQVHGGMGYVEETGAAQHWRDARIAPIYEGTNGIQAADLALRKLPLEGGDVVRAYLDEMAGLDAELRAAGDQLATISTELAEGVELLRNATELLLARENPNDALSGATPYLRLFGTVAGGYYLARQALAAHAELADGGDGPWLAAKIATARFYCEQLLPQAFGLVPAITAHADALFAIDPDLLSV
jgi:alkylation response protein AidB-like acyl-CoA dehydrogenase